MQGGIDAVKEAILYLSKYASISSLGELDTDVFEKDNHIALSDSRRRSSVKSLVTSGFHKISGSQRKSQDSSYTEIRPKAVPRQNAAHLKLEFYQTMLINAAERVSSIVKSIYTLLCTDQYQESSQHTDSLIEALLQELVPSALSLAWLVPYAAGSVITKKPKVQEHLISGCEHILWCLNDLLFAVHEMQKMGKSKIIVVPAKSVPVGRIKRKPVEATSSVITKGQKDKALVKDAVNRTIRAFIEFMDRVKVAEDWATAAAGKHEKEGFVLDLSQDPYSVMKIEKMGKSQRPSYFSSRDQRMKRPSIGELVLKTPVDATAPPYEQACPNVVYATWEKKPHRLVETCKNIVKSQIDQLNPTEHGNPDRKVSLPPSYKTIAEKLELLNILDPENDYEIVAIEHEVQNRTQQDARALEEISARVKITRDFKRNWITKNDDQQFIGEITLVGRHLILSKNKKGLRKPLIATEVSNLTFELHDEANSIKIGDLKTRDTLFTVKFTLEDAKLWYDRITKQ
jgi:hypothetical protein